MAKNRVSILLIKAGIDENNFIKEGCDFEDLESGTFYYKRSIPKVPKWINSFFNNELDDAEGLYISSVQGVFIIEREFEGENRFFALCFGYGRNLIHPNAIEERFGLITTLNSVDEKSLRSVDINSLEAIPKTNRIQSSKLSDIPNFNIDIEKDLLKAVTGKCRVAALGKNIAGTDALSLSVEVDISSISDLLDICYSQYKSESYRTNFAWVDHISVVKSATLVNDLNLQLLDKLNNRELDKIWMAIPDVIDWERVHEFRLTRKGDGYDDIDINNVLSEVYNGEPIASIDQLKTKHLTAYNIEGTPTDKWTYHKCLYAEIELEEKLYIINNGQWYRIDHDFVELINNFYDAANLSDIDLIDYTHSNEGEYNEDAANNSDQYICMDKRLIPTGVARNNIEFCDIYTSDRQMVHIKRYGGSSVLSHLFNQGLVSANLLLSSDFRRNINSGLTREERTWRLPVTARINPENYELIFGIISNNTEDRPAIPFFSKITFKNVCTTLQNYGYKVSLKRILDR